MDWSRRAPVLNFVNLGKLYSRSQKQQLWLDSQFPSSNRRREPLVWYGGLNLGNLYTRTQNAQLLEPRGWAYFEDGSVFFPRERYDHNGLQHLMRIVDPFVRGPPEVRLLLEAKRNFNEKMDDQNTQMILLEYVF